jgi:ankyrin repeat protein
MNAMSAGAGKEISQLKAGIDEANEHGRTALFSAALSGKSDDVLALLRQGASLTPDSMGDTPLHAAAQTGDIESITHLLRYFPHAVDHTNGHGETILHIAAAEGHTAVVSRLIESFHATVELLNEDGHTALFLASLFGHVECVKRLLDHATTDLHMVQDLKQRTPLHFAAQNEHLEVMECLLDKGAAVNHRDVKGHSPLHFAAYLGKTEAARLFLSKSKPDFANLHSAKTLAEENGHPETSAILSTYLAKKVHEEKKKSFPPTQARSPFDNSLTFLMALVVLPGASVSSSSAPSSCGAGSPSKYRELNG